MDFLEQFDTDNLHHAYMVVGDRASLETALLNFLEHTLQFRVHGNPNFSHTTFETFGIDDARAITDQHFRKPFHGDKKFFFLSSHSITIEAQNALLKLFEEPILGNHFFLIIPEENSIIPTLRSRMVIVHEETRVADLKEGKLFLQSSISDRLKTINQIVESKDKEQAKRLIRSITDVIHESDMIHGTGVLKDLMKAETYLSDRAPSIKMLLEHIAYRIPVTK